jgi:MFS family permease
LQKKTIYLSIAGASLGYFVDVFDLNVFNVISKQSISAIGITDPQLIATYDYQLLLWQLFGLLAGGFSWGILGDKIGRKQILFGSILVYSIANIANAFVTSIPQYIIIRFIAGFGLAGELGGAITLTSEIMDRHKRGYGSMIIVTMGALGAVAAALISRTHFTLFHFSNWQSMYLLGGVLGLFLLLFRVVSLESKMFESIKDSSSKKGSLMLLLKSKKRLKLYISCVLIGLPNWFCLGVLTKFSETFGKLNHISGGEVSVASSIMYSFIGLAVGDLLSGWLSQYFKTRKQIIFWYFNFTALFMLIYLFGNGISISQFYTLSFLLGITTGYWVLFVSLSAEQFGTNVRATVATSVPSLVRGLIIPVTLSYKFIENYIGSIYSALLIGMICLLLAYIGLFHAEETFGKELDYEEVG